MELIFYWIGGATFIISIGDLKIAVDPVLCEIGSKTEVKIFSQDSVCL
jgi:L-ascorbate metabolism protein UlaG (beta-lactamase superfamily)